MRPPSVTASSSVTATPAFVAGLNVASSHGPFGAPAVAFDQFDALLQSPPSVTAVQALPSADPLAPAIVTTTAFMPSYAPPSATVTCLAEIVAVCAASAGSVNFERSTSAFDAAYTSAVYVPGATTGERSCVPACVVTATGERMESESVTTMP